MLLGGGGAPRRSPLPPVVLGPDPLPQLVPLKPALAPARGGSSSVMPNVVWRDSISLGLPYHGRLIDGVQLPPRVRYWTTWDPALDRCPTAATAATAAPS